MQLLDEFINNRKTELNSKITNKQIREICSLSYRYLGHSLNDTIGIISVKYLGRFIINKKTIKNTYNIIRNPDNSELQKNRLKKLDQYVIENFIVVDQTGNYRKELRKFKRDYDRNEFKNSKEAVKHFNKTWNYSK